MTVPRGVAERYAFWRRTGDSLGPLTAHRALAFARDERARADILARFGEWRFAQTEYGGFASAELDDPPDGYTLRVIIGDDDCPTEWGDMEPTERERDAASSFYVAVQVLDAETGAELFHDGIGGVDVIDLPGYLHRDWEDAAGYALNEYLLPGAERFMRSERAERDHWAARDTITVDS
jgi:hypothetical protein